MLTYNQLLTLSLDRNNASFGSDAKLAFMAGVSESKNFAPVRSKFEDDTKTESIKSTMDLPVTSTVMQVVADTPKVGFVVLKTWALRTRALMQNAQ